MELYNIIPEIPINPESRQEVPVYNERTGELIDFFPLRVAAAASIIINGQNENINPTPNYSPDAAAPE